MPVQAHKIFQHLALALGGSILVLGGLFYASSNVGHDISPARLIEVIQSSSIVLFLSYLLTLILGLLVRAERYRVLLKASQEDNRPSFRDMTLITAIRNMTVDLLPARLGELVFVGLLHKRSGTRVSSGLSTLLFSTLMDILILAPVTIIIGLVVGFPNKQPYLLALIAGFIVVSMFIAMWFVLPRMTRLFKLGAKLRNRFISGMFRFILSINDALQATLHARIFTKVIALSLAVRAFKYAGLLCLFYGLTQQNFPPMAELGVFKVLGALIASEMTASMPIPTLMSFGSWELGGMTLLAFFGAMPQNALLTMLGIHIQTQALDYGIGIAALAAMWLLVQSSPAKMSPQTRQKPTRNNWVAAAFIAIAVVISWLGVDVLKSNQAKYALANSGDIMRPEGFPVPAWLLGLDGYIVWSSNRSGNHDILLMSLPSLRIRALTANPHTENFARISPDGSKVVFARSHKEWQSQRDEKPWDVWMIDVKTGQETLIAKWATAPSWTPDGRTIMFQRDPNMIMAFDLDSGKERVHYQSGQDAFMQSRVNLSTPSAGQGAKLAFTYSYFGMPINVLRNAKGEFQTVHKEACQVQWSPSGDFATYVQKGGHQTNQIMRFDPNTKQKTVLLDVPGAFSHEYFARMTQDEKYMIFGASDGGHEHDVADYEIFLWKIGSDASSAARLTFNQGNDSWPDVWLR